MQHRPENACSAGTPFPLDDSKQRLDLTTTNPSGAASPPSRRQSEEVSQTSEQSSTLACRQDDFQVRAFSTLVPPAATVSLPPTIVSLSAATVSPSPAARDSSFCSTASRRQLEAAVSFSPEIPASTGISPKFEEFTQAWENYKRSKDNWTGVSVFYPTLPSPIHRLPAEPLSPLLSPESNMAPPVAPRTMSCVIYLGIVAIFLCGFAAMLTADFTSGLVQKAMTPLRMAVRPVSCEPQPENDNEIVHIDCPIRKLQTFYPPSDFSNNLDSFKGIFFEMRVEMFQYNIVPGMFRSRLGGIWSESLLPSQEGWTWLSTAKNPDFFPHVPGSGRHFGHSLYGGGFKLERPHLIDFHAKRQLQLKEDGVFIEDLEKPPVKVTSQNTRLQDNFLYTGDPQQPQIGDIRVGFYGSAATHLSAVGQQWPMLSAWPTGDRALKGFINPLSKNNETRTLVLEGDYTAKELLDAFTYENDVPSRYLIFTRSIGFVASWIWVFFTLKLTRRGAFSTTCAMTTCCATALCFVSVGITKLTYSVPASIACVLAGLTFLLLSCGFNSKPGPPSDGHDYSVLQEEKSPTAADLQGRSPANHSSSIYAAI